MQLQVDFQADADGRTSWTPMSTQHEYGHAHRCQVDKRDAYVQHEIIFDAWLDGPASSARNVHLEHGSPQGTPARKIQKSTKNHTNTNNKLKMKPKIRTNY